MWTYSILLHPLELYNVCILSMPNLSLFYGIRFIWHNIFLKMNTSLWTGDTVSKPVSKNTSETRNLCKQGVTHYKTFSETTLFQ